jgi:hypothetical protein
MILHLKDPNDSTRKLLGLILSFSKIAGYKTNIQNQGAFLYIQKKKPPKTIPPKKTPPDYKRRKENHSIHNSLKKNLGTKLTKEVSDFYNVNYKTMKEENVDNTRKCKDFLCLWIGRINIVKMAILPK